MEKPCINKVILSYCLLRPRGVGGFFKKSSVWKFYSPPPPPQKKQKKSLPVYVITQPIMCKIFVPLKNSSDMEKFLVDFTNSMILNDEKNNC